jgi:hypothetical protein
VCRFRDTEQLNLMTIPRRGRMQKPQPRHSKMTTRKECVY